MALASATYLKPQTALQQLLEEINFQRTKEMRQLLKDGKYISLPPPYLCLPHKGGLVIEVV